MPPCLSQLLLPLRVPQICTEVHSPLPSPVQILLQRALTIPETVAQQVPLHPLAQTPSYTETPSAITLPLPQLALQVAAAEVALYQTTKTIWVSPSQKPSQTHAKRQPVGNVSRQNKGGETNCETVTLDSKMSSPFQTKSQAKFPSSSVVRTSPSSLSLSLTLTIYFLYSN